MNTTRETFEKSERLCSTKIISGLFDSGKVYYTPLFKIVWGTGLNPHTILKSGG